MAGEPHAVDLRLTSDQFEVMLDGAPSELMRLADALSGEADIVVRLLDGSGAVQRRATASRLLRTSLDDGPTLVFEGDAQAIRIIVDTLRGVAEAAMEVGEAPVRRHAHIEWLGEHDDWRDPSSVPLVVTADWPTS